MIKRLECIVICPKCDKKVGEVYAVATEDRPDIWMNRPSPDPMPLHCKVCQTVLERGRM